MFNNVIHILQNILTGNFENERHILFVLCSIFAESHLNSKPKHGNIIDFVSAKQREVSQKVAKKQKYVLSSSS